MKYTMESVCSDIFLPELIDYARTMRPTDGDTHNFSLVFEERITRLLKKRNDVQRRNITHKRSVWIAASVAAVMAAGTIAGIHQSDSRIEIYQPIENSFRFHLTDIQMDPQEMMRFPSWIPDGYSEVEVTEQAESEYLRIYQNQHGDELHFSLVPGSAEFYVDVEDDAFEVVTVNGTQAYYINLDTYATLLWCIDDIGYQLLGKCTKEDLIRMAESVG